jgi:5-methylcytosine-specific restriction protein A
MPNAALRPCNHPPCPELVVHGACPKHRTQDSQRRGSSSNRGYDGLWEKHRRTFLNQRCECSEPPLATCERCLGSGMANAWCAECKAAGYLVRATEVDHVIPWADHPHLRLDMRDFQGLCATHHSQKSLAERTGAALSAFQVKQRARVMRELMEL